MTESRPPFPPFTLQTAGQWYRSYGNELWEFTPDGLMARREAPNRGNRSGCVRS